MNNDSLGKYLVMDEAAGLLSGIAGMVRGRLRWLRRPTTGASRPWCVGSLTPRSSSRATRRTCAIAAGRFGRSQTCCEAVERLPAPVSSRSNLAGAHESNSNQ